jgi:uncharacterized cupredoxin-like copper-binding protein
MSRVILANIITDNGVNFGLPKYLASPKVTSVSSTTYTSNYTLITFSAALVASNKINGNINGVAIPETTYATSNAATLTALATAIAAITGVGSAVVSGTRAIKVYPTNAQSIATATSWAVTAGASQATVAITTSSDSLAAGATVNFANLDGSMTNYMTVSDSATTINTRLNTANTSNNIARISVTKKNDDGTTSTLPIPVNAIQWCMADPATSGDSIIEYATPANDRTIVVNCTDTVASVVAQINA